LNKRYNWRSLLFIIGTFSLFRLFISYFENKYDIYINLIRSIFVFLDGTDTNALVKFFSYSVLYLVIIIIVHTIFLTLYKNKIYNTKIDIKVDFISKMSSGFLKALFLLVVTYAIQLIIYFILDFIFASILSIHNDTVNIIVNSFTITIKDLLWGYLLITVIGEWTSINKILKSFNYKKLLTQCFYILITTFALNLILSSVIRHAIPSIITDLSKVDNFFGVNFDLTIDKVLSEVNNYLRAILIPFLYLYYEKTLNNGRDTNEQKTQ
jgi:hypothetical protein